MMLFTVLFEVFGTTEVSLFPLFCRKKARSGKFSWCVGVVVFQVLSFDQFESLR